MIQGSNFPTASTPDTESTAEFISSPASFGPSFTTGFPFEDEPRKGKKGKKGKKSRFGMPGLPGMGGMKMSDMKQLQEMMQNMDLK